MSKIVEALREELLEKVGEFVARGERWARVGETGEPSERSRELSKFISETWQYEERDNMADLCSILIGEKVVVRDDDKAFDAPGIFVTSLADDATIAYTQYGVSDIEGGTYDDDAARVFESDVFSNDAITWDPAEWRLSTDEEIRKFIRKAPKAVLLELHDMISED